jgi:hypothetical protein
MRDWITRAKMIAWSWDGWFTTAIAVELHSHLQTVREMMRPCWRYAWGYLFLVA